MLPHTYTYTNFHTHAAAWKDRSASTAINHLHELQNAAQGKICKVQTEKKQKQAAYNMKIQISFFVMKTWHLRHD